MSGSRLIVLRGNSGSGKSSVARALRAEVGYGLAWVEQDYLRRILLREPDVAGALNIRLIDQTVRLALDGGYHVVLEGILDAGRYLDMLSALVQTYRDRAHLYYFDVSFEETVRRHAGRPQAAEFTPAEMQGWYRPLDRLPGLAEQIIPATSTLDQTVRRILTETGLSPG
ncbi:kinase [Deinococcus sonorensis]|uniref:Kinase n=2 Tax=Deinococcus sonorensis TaxID=309891 RepID=A0AAU7UBS3_9DEIO